MVEINFTVWLREKINFKRRFDGDYQTVAGQKKKIPSEEDEKIKIYLMIFCHCD